MSRDVWTLHPNFQRIKGRKGREEQERPSRRKEMLRENIKVELEGGRRGEENRKLKEEDVKGTKKGRQEKGMPRKETRRRTGM